MTVHETGFAFTVYPDEMIAVLSALNFAKLHPEFAAGNLTQDQKDALEHFIDSFADLALENAA